jgi:hypothetical protein
MGFSIVSKGARCGIERFPPLPLSGIAAGLERLSPFVARGFVVPGSHRRNRGHPARYAGTLKP